MFLLILVLNILSEIFVINFLVAYHNMNIFQYSYYGYYFFIFPIVSLVDFHAFIYVDFIFIFNFSKYMPVIAIKCDNFFHFRREMNRLSINSDRNWIFRGESDSDYKLSTSIDRVVAENNGYDSLIEQALINEIAKRTGRLIGATELDKLDKLMNWLAELQHYGAPTRLMDWTYNLDIAIYFALSEIKIGKKITIYATKSDLYMTLNYVINDSRIVDNFLGATPLSEGARFLTSLELGAFFYQVPLNMNPRLKAQEGVFLVQGIIRDYPFEHGLDNSRFQIGGNPIIYKFIIDSSYLEKWMKRINLYFHGIKKSKLFPDPSYDNPEELKTFAGKILTEIFPDSLNKI